MPPSTQQANQEREREDGRLEVHFRLHAATDVRGVRGCMELDASQLLFDRSILASIGCATASGIGLEK